MDEPKTRQEVYLKAIAEGEGDVPTPITRKELFYSAILGNIEVEDLPEPVTREEVYLKTIAENGGGGGGKTPTIYNYSNYIDNGTFTATESGLYMAVATCSYAGTTSLTWAEGKTPYISEDLSGDGVLFKYRIGQLEEGDTVTLSAIASSWIANSIAVFKLEHINISEQTFKVKVEAQRAISFVSYTPLQDDKKHFIFAVTMGRMHGNYRDDTDMVGINIDYHADFEVGVNTLDCFFVGTGADMPTIKLYQYDGGGTLIADYIIG